MNIALVNWGRKSQPIEYRNNLPDYPQCMIIVVCHGSLRVEWEDDNKNSMLKDLRDRSVLLLPPHASFVLSTPDSGYAGHFVEIDRAACPWPPVVNMVQSDIQVQRCVADIESEFEQSEDLSAIPLLYQLLFCRCAQLLKRSSDEVSLVEQVDAVLRANASTDASLGDLLKHFPYSERHLRRLYQEQSALSIKQSFIQIKLNEAKRLLTQTDMSITAIAHELSYPSSQYFSGLFKQHVGQTPSAFRAAE